MNENKTIFLLFGYNLRLAEWLFLQFLLIKSDLFFFSSNLTFLKSDFVIPEREGGVSDCGN